MRETQRSQGWERMELVRRKLEEIREYPNNPRKNEQAADAVAESIRQCGYIAPIIVDECGVILAGHTRYKALQKLGRDEAEVVVKAGLTDEQKAKYRLLDNKTGELADWDFGLLQEELEGLDFGELELEWGVDSGSPFWGNISGERTEEYEQFEEKFKPKLTTDDCYTPPKVYEAVKAWAVEKYNLAGNRVLRPFYPGGDYQSEAYNENDVVIDNPPFSILSEICRFYMERGVPFFLFAPSLTLFSSASGACNYIVCDADVIYENGAHVNTSFVTNMGDEKILTAPELGEAIQRANKKEAVELAKYDYPENLITAARLGKWVEKGARISIKNAVFVRALDSQRAEGKTIYGGGFLISTKAAENTAAEKAAVEKAAVEKESVLWPLSDREKTIVEELDRKERQGV